MSESHEGGFQFETEREKFKRHMEEQRALFERKVYEKRVRVMEANSVESKTDSLIKEIERLRVENANLRNENGNLYAKIRKLTYYSENNKTTQQSGFIVVPKKEGPSMYDIFASNWESVKEFIKNIGDKTIKWFNS